MDSDFQKENALGKISRREDDRSRDIDGRQPWIYIIA
jgi:hypothetical protein